VLNAAVKQELASDSGISWREELHQIDTVRKGCEDVLPGSYISRQLEPVDVEIAGVEGMEARLRKEGGRSQTLHEQGSSGASQQVNGWTSSG